MGDEPSLQWHNFAMVGVCVCVCVCVCEAQEGGAKVVETDAPSGDLSLEILALYFGTRLLLLLLLLLKVIVGGFFDTPIHPFSLSHSFTESAAKKKDVLRLEIMIHFRSSSIRGSIPIANRCKSFPPQPPPPPKNDA